MSDREFTSDWVTSHTPTWESIILPCLPAAPAAVDWLEMGSYEGRSACWVHDHVLTQRPGSHLICVDVWGGPYAASPIEARFDHNTANLAGVQKVKARSQAFLLSAPLPSLYDVIYVDADHQAKSALLDAAHAWPRLKPGGVLFFDDYPWQYPAGDDTKRLPPKAGIDAFLSCWASEMTVLHVGWQVIVRKHS